MRDDLVTRLEQAGFVVVESRLAWVHHPVAGVPAAPTDADRQWLLEVAETV